jgi:hypothetical protein
MAGIIIVTLFNRLFSSFALVLTNSFKMKKTIVIALVYIVLPVAIYAQGVGLGIKVGANFVNQEVKDVSTKTVTDYHFGAYLNLNFTDKFGITPEVLYSANGSKWEDIKVDYDYIAIPVMIRYKPISLISLEAGPQFSFLTKAKVEGVGDVRDQLKKNDFGLAFGAGVHLPLNLNAGLRYVLGFTDVSDVSEESIKNRTFQIYVGWTIFGKN